MFILQMMSKIVRQGRKINLKILRKKKKMRLKFYFSEKTIYKIKIAT